MCIDGDVGSTCLPNKEGSGDAPVKRRSLRLRILAGQLLELLGPCASGLAAVATSSNSACRAGKAEEEPLATVNYLSRDAPDTGLYAVGKYPPKVGVRRDRLGNDVEAFGTEKASTSVRLVNARGLDLKLDQHATQLVKAPYHSRDYCDIDAVLGEYYDECCRLVQEATGARKVLAFDHNIRSHQKAGEAMGGGFAVQPPLALVHGDYTEESAVRRVRDMTKVPKKNDTLRRILGDKPPLQEDADELLSHRFCLINVWRSIHPCPLERSPLGILSPASISEKDIIVHEIHYEDRVGENYNARHADSHIWWVFPHMHRDEALLLKCWDSAGTFVRQPPPGLSERVESTFAFHAAVDVPVRPDAPDRESIEVRTIALF